MARPKSTGSPNEYWLAQPCFLDIGGTNVRNARFPAQRGVVSWTPRPRHLPGIEASPAAPPARHRSQPPCCPGHRIPSTCRIDMLKFSSFFIADQVHSPDPAAPPARHRSLQPAKPAPRSGFFHQGRNSDFALHRGRNSDFGILPEKPITGPAPKVYQRGGPRRTADRVFFFTIHTPCRLGAGLPP